MTLKVKFHLACGVSYLLVCASNIAISQLQPRMDKRIMKEGNYTREKIPKQRVYLIASLKMGGIIEPEPGAYPELSKRQREYFRCRDSEGQKHLLASKWAPFGIECTYYECEYNADTRRAAWVLYHDIFKCCFHEDYGYKENAMMEGRCTKKECVRNATDTHFEGALGWNLTRTGCRECNVGLVLAANNETYHVGDPCRHFQCMEAPGGGRLVETIESGCCRSGDRLITDGSPVLVRNDSCMVSICNNGSLSDADSWQNRVNLTDYISGCPVFWTLAHGECYKGFTQQLTLMDASKFCNSLDPTRRSRLIEIYNGGEILSMSDVMELGRWYWLTKQVDSLNPEYMSDSSPTPERFLVGHHYSPTVKKVNRLNKLEFRSSQSSKNAFVCTMHMRAVCKPIGYTERKPSTPPPLKVDEL